MSVLCIIAHPDDLEPQAGGTIARLSETKDVVVVYLCAPQPNGSGVDLNREQEAILAGAQLRLTHVEFLRWPAEEVRADFDHISAVDEFCRMVAPTLVIGHGVEDSQQHHREAALIARTLVRRNRIDLWEMDHSMPAGLVDTKPRPNLFVDVTGVYARKMRAVEAYRSLEAKHPGIRDGIIARDRYYGFMLNQDGDTAVQYAEGFISRRSVWL